MVLYNGAKALVKHATNKFNFPSFQDIVWDFQLGKELVWKIIMDFGAFIIVLAISESFWLQCASDKDDNDTHTLLTLYSLAQHAKMQIRAVQ